MITPTEAETDTDAGGGLQHGGLRLGLKVPKLWEKGATPTTTPKVASLCVCRDPNLRGGQNPK